MYPHCALGVYMYIHTLGSTQEMELIETLFRKSKTGKEYGPDPEISAGDKSSCMFLCVRLR